MCIIIAKPAGVKMPSDQIISDCFDSNPDGAGYMFAHKDFVHVHKGFMKLDDLRADIDKVKNTVDLEACAVVLHFRISTSGGVCPENTHPFPITSATAALKKLSFRSTIAAAHNGIIRGLPITSGLSDTMEYISGQLAPMYSLNKAFYRLKAGQSIIEAATSSKWAFLDSRGKIYMVGMFLNDGGVYYSNSTYKPCALSAKSLYRGVYAYDDYDEYGGDGTTYRYNYSTGKYQKKSTGIYTRVMWLNSGDYVMTSGGKILDGDLFGVDACGSVYTYAEDMTGDVVRMIGYSAYNSANMPVTYDPKIAEPCFVGFHSYRKGGDKYEN